MAILIFENKFKIEDLKRFIVIKYQDLMDTNQIPH